MNLLSVVVGLGKVVASAYGLRGGGARALVSHAVLAGRAGASAYGLRGGGARAIVSTSVNATAFPESPEPVPAEGDDREWGSARLDRLIAHATGASRKDVARALRKGLVLVDGKDERDGARKLQLGGVLDVVYSGEALELRPPPLIVAFHKPLGVVSSMSDDRGRADLSSVLKDLPPIWIASLHPVGRLDADSTGLLLFCSDGGLTQRLLHPRFETQKEYVALVSGAPLTDGGAALREVLLGGVKTTEGTHVAELLEVKVMEMEEGQEAAAAHARAVAAAGLTANAQAGIPVASLRLSVTEGKHRMVRRMLANAGHPVEALHRVRFGAVELNSDRLPPGASGAIEGEALLWAEALRRGET
ncbi:pseudouridine synthase [Pavlovales sp. CCMP2436]|nr:pseudouridine synthase [Pavlovales sp. CCMP2436]